MENAQQAKWAVLIDADNTSSAAAQGLFEEIAKYGTASVKRIYGDWSSHTLNGWREVLLKHALVPIQQFAYTKGKDATDMSLIIEAMDLLYTAKFSGFCLVSSDSDFTPLAARIRASGLMVYGFGRKTTPEAFRQACDKFFYLENLTDTVKTEKVSAHQANHESAIAEAVPEQSAAKAITARHMDAATRQLLYKAIKDATGEDTGWAYVGRIGNHINQTHPDFDSRNYGYSKLSSMLRDLRGLQFRIDNNSQMFCRKIPFSALVKLLEEACNKFQNAKGLSNIDAVSMYIKPRWNWQDFGFQSFHELLENVDAVESDGQTMKMRSKKS